MQILTKEESENRMKELMSEGILRKVDLMKNGIRKCTILAIWKEERNLKEVSVLGLLKNIIVPVEKEEINNNSLKKLDSAIEKRNGNLNEIF